MKSLQNTSGPGPGLLARLPAGPWSYPLAFAAGALGVLGFAPFAWFPLLALGQGLLFWLLLDASPRRGLGLGYAYGLGLMGLGVSWLRISLAEFAYVPPWLAGLYTLGFVLCMALYYGLAGWAIARLGQGRGLRARLLLLAPSVWLLLEWLRGWLFTGFPWLQTGYAWIDSPLAGFAPLFGAQGMGLLGLWLAAALAWLLIGPRRLQALGLLALIPLAGLLLQQASWSQPLGGPFRVSLIQANIPQSLKWKPDHLRESVAAHLALTRQHWDSQLIIWPETAVPAMAGRVQTSLLQPLDQEARARDLELLIGIPRERPGSAQYFNSLQNLGGTGAHYAKRHLVPFGEYVPLPGLLQPLVDGLGVEMGDFVPGEGPSWLPVLGRLAGISICYEVVFANLVRQALPQAGFLVNVSNDGWFGDSLAPWQHLQIARMRALETGRYLLRATNTGISAIIRPDGCLQAQSGLLQADVVSGQVQPRQGATPYVRWGDGPALALAILGLLLRARLPPMPPRQRHSRGR
ncbi:MAG: apolipoprotein N-acyltransferase [Gammaproteobacteria bacterium SHHR-1]